MVTVLATGVRLEAQSPSNPVGLFMLGAYNGSTYLGLLANSDTLVSAPFTRAPQFIGTIQSVSTDVVTVEGAPGWTANQFVYAQSAQPNHYYALIGANTSGGSTNSKEGSIYQIASNTTNSLTLSLNGDVITSIPANSQITVIPYWTLGTIFPAANAGVSFTPTASTRSFKTEVLTPNYEAQGENLGYSGTYYFIDSGTNVGWREFTDSSTTDHSNDILLPDSYFVVRNQNSAPTLPLAIVGNVLTGKVTIPETTLATQAQDNDVTIIRPIAVTLNNSGLNPTDGSFVATTSTRSFKDQLLVYSNTQVALNKSSSGTYYYMNGAWRSFTDSPTVDHGNDPIPAGSALTIRKVASGTGYTDFWQNTPTY